MAEDRPVRAAASTRAVALAVAGAAGLAACGSLIPTYERPAAPIPGVWPDAPAMAASGVATAPPASTVDAPPPDWQAFYADARLKRLIALALENNRDLRVAVLNIEQTRATYDVRRADQFPTLNLGGTVNRGVVSGVGLATTYAVGLAVSSYELDLFGRVHDLSEAALAQFFANVQNRQAVQISLVAQVATAYIQLLADDELVRVTRETLGTREESARLTKLRFDNGAASELDYQQSVSLLEGARATLAQSLRARAQDANGLQLLVGSPLPADLPAPGRLEDVLAGIDPPPGLPSTLLERRPDIRAAEQQLLAANATIGAARAAFFPRISLTGTYGSASLELSGLFKGGSWTFTGTGSLLQPIFDFGRNRANLEVARANFDIARAQYERSIQAAFRDVADALAGRSTFGEQRRAQAAQVEALEKTYRLSDLRYRAGASSYLDALDAQRSLFAAQQALVQVRAQQLQNAVSLYRALGGGWSEPAGGP